MEVYCMDKNQAETELHKAQVQASRSAKALEEAIDTFEQKKLTDLKQVLGNFIRIEMSYHAKCLESLTKAYKNLSVVDTDEDLEEFRNILHPTSAIERQQMLRSVGGGSRASLNSQRSEFNQRSGSRSATPKHTVSSQRPPSKGSGGVPSSAASGGGASGGGAKVDMFTAQGAAAKASPQRPVSNPQQSPQRTQQQPQKHNNRPSMLGDDDSETEDSDEDSGSDLNEVEPMYATVNKRR